MSNVFNSLSDNTPSFLKGWLMEIYFMPFFCVPCDFMLVAMHFKSRLPLPVFLDQLDTWQDLHISFPLETLRALRSALCICLLTLRAATLDWMGSWFLVLGSS